MSKLLSRAKICLEHAESDYSKINENDCYMDSCCFSLQQSIEFLLKGIVEMNGLDYAENHDVRAKLNILARHDISIPCEKEIRDKASILYSWETESRYKDSFIAAINDIEEVTAIAKSLMKYATQDLREIEVEEIEFPTKKLVEVQGKVDICDVNTIILER